MMKTVMITLLAISLFGQTAKVEHINKDTVPVSDLSDTIKSQIAKAQRDYLSVQIQMQSVGKTLQDATVSATDFCNKIGRTYDAQNIVCAAKPEPPKK